MTEPSMDRQAFVDEICKNMGHGDLEAFLFAIDDTILRRWRENELRHEDVGRFAEALADAINL